MSRHPQIYPGKLVEKLVRNLGLSLPEAAEKLGMSRAQLHRIVTGKSAISPEAALRLETVFGTSAEQWLTWQASYDALKVRKNAKQITKGLRPYVPEEAAAPPRAKMQ